MIDSRKAVYENTVDKNKLLKIIDIEIKNVQETKPVRNKSIRQYSRGIIKGLEIAKQYIDLCSEE